jgi:hypothetical protein
MQQQQQQLSLSSSRAHKSKAQQVQRQKTHRIREFSTLQRTSGHCPGAGADNGNKMEITIFFNPLSFVLSSTTRVQSLFFFFFFFWRMLSPFCQNYFEKGIYSVTNSPFCEKYLLIKDFFFFNHKKLIPVQYWSCVTFNCFFL